MLLKCCTQYARKSGKLSNGHRTVKGQFSFQSQRKAMPKNVQTTAELHSFHKVMLKILQTRLQQYANQELPDVQARFRKGRGTRGQNVKICGIIKKAREFQKNICFCFIAYAQAFECVDHKKLWKILKVLGIPDHFTHLERPICRSRKQLKQLKPNMEQWTGSKLRMQYIKPIYCHPAYLT